ncbi:MAG: phage holin family protein [Actinomycetota bacterium]
MNISSDSRPLEGQSMDSSPSIGQLMSDIGQDLSTLVHQELDLAKAEARKSATQAGRGAGLLAGAATAMQLALVFFSIAAWWAIGTEIGRGWAALIVAATWAALAGGFAFLGKKEMTAMRGLKSTSETVGKIPAALQGREERNR